jgi:hypothetical protein
MELTNWHKSSRSGNQGDCVEIGHTPEGHLVGIRDSKDPGPVLLVGRTAWAAFLDDLRLGLL